MTLEKKQVIEIMERILEGFKSGDTLEGSFEFTCNTMIQPENKKDTREYFEVTASYRVGNLEGQGGLVLIKPSVEITLDKQ